MNASQTSNHQILPGSEQKCVAEGRELCLSENIVQEFKKSKTERNRSEEFRSFRPEERKSR